MLRSTGESVESVQKKKRKATVERICRKRSLHYLRSLEYESISFFDFVMDSQYSSVLVILLSKPLL